MTASLFPLTPDRSPSPAVTMRPATEFRPRRSHEKSRAGCVRCKQQRKKCDEAKPRCSRCAGRNHTCNYPERQSESHTSGEKQKRKQATSRRDSIESQISNLAIPLIKLASPDSLPSASSTVSFFEPPSPHPSTSEDDDEWRPNMESFGALDATEMSLLGHYLTRTSHTIPFDQIDVYALQVGIPNLALRSKPLMASLLALSGASKCHDIIQTSSTPLERLDEIRDLLVLADNHHSAALREIQASIPIAADYNHILANAALMVLYCFSSHCVRVRIAEAARSTGELLPGEILPLQSQWVYLIRAAHTAYTGLLNASHDNSDIRSVRSSTSRMSDMPLPLQADMAALPGNLPLHPEDGPSEETRQFFFPVVATTCNDAFEKLRSRAQSIAVHPDLNEWQDPETHGHISDLQACLVSLDILQEVVANVFSADSTPEPSLAAATTEHEHPLGCLDGVFPWLRNYAARVTSAVPSKPLRRTITAFLNRVPLEYLSIVQSVLDFVPLVPGQDEAGLGWEVPGAGCGASGSEAQKLAMEIFAHWLVLFMLLDGVWWIGGIGEWELGRVVSFMRAQGWVDSSADENGQIWWPESMHKMKKELAGATYEKFLDPDAYNVEGIPDMPNTPEGGYGGIEWIS